jgi:hypothetical protein
MILGLVGKLMSHKNGLIPIRKSYTFKKWPKLKRKEQRVFGRHEGIYKVGYTGVREQECLAYLLIHYTHIIIYYLNLYLTLQHFKAAMHRLTWPPAREEREGEGPCTLGI